MISCPANGAYRKEGVVMQSPGLQMEVASIATLDMGILQNAMFFENLEIPLSRFVALLTILPTTYPLTNQRPTPVTPPPLPL
jgi:hypothetical protein